MTMYLVSYDLRLGATSDDYARMDDALSTLGAHRVQFSLWVVVTGSSAEAVARHLRRYQDGNDRLLVSEMGAWASYNAMVDINTVKAA